MSVVILKTIFIVLWATSQSLAHLQQAADGNLQIVVLGGVSSLNANPISEISQSGFLRFLKCCYALTRTQNAHSLIVVRTELFMGKYVEEFYPVRHFHDRIFHFLSQRWWRICTEINKYAIHTGGNEYLTSLAPKVVSIKFLFTTSTQSTGESREKSN